MATSIIDNSIRIVEQKTVTMDDNKVGTWTYRKWSDGTAECWGEWHSGSFAPSTAVGGFYGRVPSDKVLFPSGLFISTPNAFFSLYSWGTGYYWGTVRNTTKDGFFLMLFRNDNASSEGSGHVYAIGAWK